jgi:hypothetical protein
MRRLARRRGETPDRSPRRRAPRAILAHESKSAVNGGIRMTTEQLALIPLDFLGSFCQNGCLALLHPNIVCIALKVL